MVKYVYRLAIETQNNRNARLLIPNKYDKLTRCQFDAGPPLTTPTQHWASVPCLMGYKKFTECPHVLPIRNNSSMRDDVEEVPMSISSYIHHAAVCHQHSGPHQQTQNIFIAFVQRRPNVFDVGPTLYKCYTKMCVCWNKAGEDQTMKRREGVLVTNGINIQWKMQFRAMSGQINFEGGGGVSTT